MSDVTPSFLERYHDRSLVEGHILLNVTERHQTYNRNTTKMSQPNSTLKTITKGHTITSPYIEPQVYVPPVSVLPMAMHHDTHLPARSTRLTTAVLSVVSPAAFFARCTKVMPTMVCARLLVAFMRVAATVLLAVPASIRAAMSS